MQNGRILPREGVADEARLNVEFGSRVIVVSNLFIKRASPEREELKKFSSYLATIDGPGHLIIAGNLFDLSNVGANSIDDIVADNSDFFNAIESLIVERGFDLSLVPGSKDSELVSLCDSSTKFYERFQPNISTRFVLDVQTATGPRQIVVAADLGGITTEQEDDREILDSIQKDRLFFEFLPRIARKSRWLDGIEFIDNPSLASRFVASRVFYRQALRYLPFLLIPLLVSYLIRIPLFLSVANIAHLKNRVTTDSNLIRLGALATAIDAVVIFIIASLIIRRVYASIIGSSLNDLATDSDPNATTRMAALESIDDFTVGIVVGDSINAELTELFEGFFASPGSVATTYHESRSRLGLPTVFQPHLNCTWIEIQPGAKIRVRLYSQTEEARLRHLGERIARLGMHDKNAGIRILAAYPGGENYHKVPDIERNSLARPRRLISLAVFAVGVIDLISTLAPPFHVRLRLITEFLPISIPVLANAIAAMESIGLIALSSGLRRGQRSAFILTLALASTMVATNLIKGADVEESILTLILTVSLIASRRSFRAPTNRESLAKGLLRIPIFWLLVALAATATLKVELSIFSRRSNLSLPRTFEAVIQRMFGIQSVPLPHVINEFLTPSLVVASLSLFALLVFRGFRPVVEIGVSKYSLSHRSNQNAKEVVTKYSSSTLDYFALRDDKVYFFAYSCVIAYAVIGTVALVSPDPIGPPATSKQAWNSFRTFVANKGWNIAVLGAGEEWLATYGASGLRSIYIGDEAVVEVENFTLAGNRNKSMRQAVNRMRNHGYSIKFANPAELDEVTQNQLLDVLTKSRRGGVERGFSMTLGRFLDERDDNLLLTICLGPTGDVVGFCQWVPAPGIEGFSLDLMRRDLGEHPNGLTDLMVVATIEHLKDLGCKGLSLNFATMRAIIAGDGEDALSTRVERWFLKRLSDTMQIESLWRFNSKFSPTWLPRYLVYESPDTLPQVAIAIARAESFWELPIIGKFLTPKT
ncbi:MAG: phosphatidylglycerol lysyltransferase domain-containing protein [Actinomycetota bacterium]|nr:phosphatidylglycerol lysyltransferase domain-containing protein [Actinomycetota bacterium]